MLRDTTLKIALAGLMHDIGKFAQGSLDVTKEYLNNNAGLYQPFYDGQYTHVHAVYTAAFIEQMAQYLPQECNDRNWGEGDSFINLAAGHHNPKTPMQWIIAEADRISSGLDRDEFEKGEKIAVKDFKKTRLLPILESLGPDRCKEFDRREKYNYRYKLSSVSADSIFPTTQQELENTNCEVEYKKLFDEFCSKLKGLYHKNVVALWTQHFDSLLMAYTSLIPAARVGEVVHDVSLYDHCKTTAALASALYQYHARTDTLKNIKDIKNREEKKLLLVGGDFYGIQDFIFNTKGESNKFMSKLLRGRSFVISVWMELAAKLICDSLDLPYLSVFLNTAGKFHLLAPNTPEVITKINECKDIINNWLFSHTYGENSIGIAYSPASLSQFQIGYFKDLWEEHLKELEYNKFRKLDLSIYGGVISNFLDKFDNKLENSLCPLCGRRPANSKTKGDKLLKGEVVSCLFCRDHIFLGTNIVKDHLIAICKNNSYTKEKLSVPIFDKFQLFFTNDELRDLASKGELLDLWECHISKDGTLPCRATIKLFNGHVPCYDIHDYSITSLGLENNKELSELRKEGEIKNFSDIALKAKRKEGDEYKGLEALGVLKIDVDNLAMLLGCGFLETRYTLSRLITLSRQMNFFFSLYLPHLLSNYKQFYDTYTVFAGGDDLFLIGPWNKMINLSEYLNNKFHNFVCENSEITISAGLTIHKANTPFNIIAKNVESALSQAKIEGKNAIHIFGNTVNWEIFSKLLEIRNVMNDWLNQNYISKGMFYKFNIFINMAETESKLFKKRSITIDDLNCLKWKSLFYYSIIRNINKEFQKDNKVLRKICKMVSWLEQYRGVLRISLWSFLYEQRK